jgi:hypothetical protein
MEVDEPGQWVAMLALNRATHAMSVVEEALVLREMGGDGHDANPDRRDTPSAQELRRIGLIERLHPELVEQVAGQDRQVFLRRSRPQYLHGSRRHSVEDSQREAHSICCAEPIAFNMLR